MKCTDTMNPIDVMIDATRLSDFWLNQLIPSITGLLHPEGMKKCGDMLTEWMATRYPALKELKDFEVICDDSNNPPELILKGGITAQINVHLKYGEGTNKFILTHPNDNNVIAV